MNSSEKLITILKTLSRAPFEFSATELSRVIECGRSGTYKLLSTLAAEGMVEQKANKKYRLGLASYLIGKSYEEHVGLWRFAKPFLEKLRDQTHENASLAVWSEGHVTVLYKAESRELIRVVGSVGVLRPINASAMGKTLAAYLDWGTIEEMAARTPLVKYTPKTIVDLEVLRVEFQNIRNKGHTISNGEFSADAIGIGAPVRNKSGSVWAAISIGAPLLRVTDEKVQNYIQLVRDTANQISMELMSKQ